MVNLCQRLEFFFTSTLSILHLNYKVVQGHLVSLEQVPPKTATTKEGWNRKKLNAMVSFVYSTNAILYYLHKSQMGLETNGELHF